MTHRIFPSGPFVCVMDVYYIYAGTVLVMTGVRIFINDTEYCCMYIVRSYEICFFFFFFFFLFCFFLLFSITYDGLL